MSTRKSAKDTQTSSIDIAEEIDKILEKDFVAFIDDGTDSLLNQAKIDVVFAAAAQAIIELITRLITESKIEELEKLGEVFHAAEVVADVTRVDFMNGEYYAKVFSERLAELRGSYD